MSAFVVEEKTINRILSLLSLKNNEWLRNEILKRTGYDVHSLEGLDQLGKALLQLNVSAVNQRYNTHEADEYSGFKPLPVTPIQALKSLECLFYQCTEGNVPETDLYKTMDMIIGIWRKQIVQSLPEWQRAEWG